MRVLVVGAGIAGATLAYWLRARGHEPTLLERSPAPRRGGYVLDFWGAGFDVAERMGIVPRLMTAGYRFREVREVSDRGRRVAHMDPRPVIDRTGGRYVTVARSDLAAAALDALDADVEQIFGDTVAGMEDDGRGVQVALRAGGDRRFDLVVGADGLHSAIRAQAFGPERAFERDLGIAVAAFDVEGYRPRDELVAVTRTTVGMQVLRVALRDDTTMFCVMFRHGGEAVPDDVAAQQAMLHRRLEGAGWEAPAILERLPEARTFYLDTASQIRMPSWSRGRVALVGDAAAAPSLLAGQGSALAMIEAYTLAARLAEADGDHRAAFTAYERQLAPAVRAKQDAAIGLGAAFAPRNRGQLLLRNAALGLMGVPLVARLALGRSLRDPIPVR